MENKSCCEHCIKAKEIVPTLNCDNCPCHQPSVPLEGDWETKIWQWAEYEFPHTHVDKFGTLLEIIRTTIKEAREEGKNAMERVFHKDAFEEGRMKGDARGDFRGYMEGLENGKKVGQSVTGDNPPVA